MNKTIKLSAAGIAAVGAAGSVLLGALPSDAATGTAGKPGTLHASQLKYVDHTWACGPKGTLDGLNCQVGAQTPKGWKWTKLDRYQARFDDRSKTWMLRIDGDLPNAGSTAAMAKAKQKALRGTPGLKILSVKTASLPNTATQSRITFTTVTYTYRDARRGTRWVATRYADPMDGGAGAQEELTVGGRPQDAAALGTVLNRATQTVALAG